MSSPGHGPYGPNMSTFPNRGAGWQQQPGRSRIGERGHRRRAGLDVPPRNEDAAANGKKRAPCSSRGRDAGGARWPCAPGLGVGFLSICAGAVQPVRKASSVTVDELRPDYGRRSPSGCEAAESNGPPSADQLPQACIDDADRGAAMPRRGPGGRVLPSLRGGPWRSPCTRGRSPRW
jgi:hypothetical protein